MRRRIIGCLMVAVLLLAMLAGCQPADTGGDPAQDPEKPLVTATVDPRLIGTWTRLGVYEDDLDGDGGKEMIELLTAAQRDSKGEIMWDDGQNWLLVVDDGDKIYPLFAGYVQMGSIYFDVIQNDAGPAEIIVLNATGAGLEMAQYKYDQAAGGYRKDTLYESGAFNLMYTSFPGYR